MGDLISRSDLIEKLKDLRIDNISLNGKSIVDIIAEQPTAYNVEKVVAELEDKSQYCIPINGQAFTGIKTEYAIDIVKRGGADGKI